MRSQMSKGDSNRLLQALALAKEKTRQMEQQQEDKRWQPISVPLRLSDALAKLTKHELTQIRIHLGITNISILKKQELAAELEKRIPEAIESVIPTMDHDRYQIIQKLVSHDGQMAAPKLETKQLAYFRERGIVFTGSVDGSQMLAMPQQLVDKLKSLIADPAYNAIARRNTEWILLSRGLLYYYGTLTLGQLHEMLTRYTGETVNLWDYLDVLVDSVSYYGEIRHDAVGFSNSRVFDAKIVRQEQESRPDIEYFPFPKEQLLKAGEPGFVDRNGSVIGFANYIFEHYKISRQRADLVAEECEYAARSGEPLSNLMSFLQSQFEFDSLESVQALTEKLVDVMNNTRQWFLKGYSPAELFAATSKHLAPMPTLRADVIDIRSRQKSGRNDPCPCGSGKKFKKCCMTP